MEVYADRNGLWDKVGTGSGVVGTVDQLLVDNAIMDKVRNNKKILAIVL